MGLFKSIGLGFLVFVSVIYVIVSIGVLIYSIISSGQLNGYDISHAVVVLFVGFGSGNYWYQQYYEMTCT